MLALAQKISEHVTRASPCLHELIVINEAFHLQDVTDTLKKDREGRGARKWRAAFRRIQQQLLDLEQDSKALELVYPQVYISPLVCSQ